MRQQPSTEYRGFRTAGIRMTEELMDGLEFHRTEELYDTLEAIHQFDKAHVVMLTEQGLIPRDDGAAILREIRAMESSGAEEARMDAQGGKHSGEQHLIRRLGEDVGGRINLARSSGDLGQVGRHFTIRDHVVKVAVAVCAFRETLIDLAERHSDVVMPGYTFLQHAQPTTLGHWFSMWASVMERTSGRLAEMYGRVNVSPAGAAILSGSDFEVDRSRVAEFLGFDRPAANTMDAVFSHDVSLEACTTIATAWNDLARLADDLELWFSAEFAFIDVPDRYCGTSSIMPQKRNPSLPQNVKAVAAKAIGNVTTGFASERGPTGQAMFERYETQRILWETMGALPELLHDVSLMLKDLTADRQRLLDAAGRHWGTATDLAGALVRKTGISWRSAHQVTAIVVRLGHERGITPREVRADLVDEAASEYFGRKAGLTDEEIATALDPAAFVARRTLCGGPAAEPHQRTLDELRTTLRRDKTTTDEWVTTRRDRQDLLETAIDRILA